MKKRAFTLFNVLGNSKNGVFPKKLKQKSCVGFPLDEKASEQTRGNDYGNALDGFMVKTKYLVD